MWNAAMKKTTIANHQKERQDKSQKIYKSISDRVKILDDARGCAHQIRDLFQPSIQIHRSKLQDHCERLIFTLPLTFGVKAEELLWRKAYYEVISTAKLLKKQEYSIEEKSCIVNLINAGIGHFHHYLSRLQTEFEVSFDANIDFMTNQKEAKSSEPSSELEEWCRTSIHRSLIYLGDLCRYKLEVHPNCDPNLAIRYYSQALLLKPEIGMPHNQMGTMAASLNQNLDATYHYIQCLMSANCFEGAENNLHRLFEKNAQFLEHLPVESAEGDGIVPLEPTEHVRRFIARFLLLADVWFFNKKIQHIYDLCHQTNVDLQECLSFMRPISSESSGSQNGDTIDSESVSCAAFLTNDMMFKIIVICLQCITKLQLANNSHQLSNVIAFTLAVYSQLVQHVAARLEETILNFHLQQPAKKQRKSVGASRRRKKLLSANSDDSETESEVEHSASGESEDEDDCIVELQESSSEEEDAEQKGIVVVENDEDDKSSKDVSKEVLSKAKMISFADLMDIVAEEAYFQSVNVLSNWFCSDLDVLRNCGRSTQSLFTQLVYLLNIIGVDGKKVTLPPVIRTDLVKIPLCEDVLLKEMEILKEGQNQLDWQRFGKMIKVPGVAGRMQFEVLVRITKLIGFGKFLEQHHETGVRFDAKTGKFLVDSRPDVQSNGSSTIIEPLDSETKVLPSTQDRDTKQQLMKNMGQLWLAAEVRDLESRVKGKMSLSPYLVVDVDALIKHMGLVKHLVYARKFLVLVPTAVLCALDDLKKSKLEARDAIRWLEAQFRQGNRFFRPQRHHEQLALPLIKYPKKKDKEAAIYIQIVECCHYLGEQEKRGSTMVTLLSGDAGALSTSERREFSYVGLAQSAGVNVELITKFYAKWKKTAKGKSR